MAELLKNIYNEKFFHIFTKSVQEIVPNFAKKAFLNDIYDNEWENRELKQRMRHITLVFQKHLSEDYTQNIKTILALIPVLLKNGVKPDNLEYIFFPDFIEVYGQDHYPTSVNAMEKITQFVTCEFGIRPFILRYQEEMLAQMLEWTNHNHHSVRRLATEGCRPRLPWAMGIPALKKNPNPILPILKKLKSDPSESVRRSVANNLNDISKDHPQIVIDIAHKWKGTSKEIDSLVKHACRTLLKQGNPEVMELFGFGAIDNIEIENFQILTPKVNIGAYLEFSFRFLNKSEKASLIRLEYGVYYQKANGTLSKKVFKISEKIYAEHSETAIHRKHSFKVITTRKFHLGKHQVALIINGKELESYDFQLEAT